MEATATPEIGTTTDLALFDSASLEVRNAMAIIDAAPTPTDPASRKKLYEILADGAKMKTFIDNRRLVITKPLRDRVEAINTYAQDNLIKPLEAKIAERKREISTFDAAEEKKRQAELARIKAEAEEKAKAAAEEQRKIREAAEADARRIAAEEKAKADAAAEGLRGIAKVKAQQEADARAKAAQVAAAASAAEAESKAAIDASIAQAELRNQAEDLEAQKTKGAGKVWTFEVEDITKVPHEYLEVVNARVTARVRDGVRVIPGIRIFQKDSLALR